MGGIGRSLEATDQNLVEWMLFGQAGQHFACSTCLLTPFFGERHVHVPRKNSIRIRGAFTVTEENPSPGVQTEALGCFFFLLDVAPAGADALRGGCFPLVVAVSLESTPLAK